MKNIKSPQYLLGLLAVVTVFNSSLIVNKPVHLTVSAAVRHPSVNKQSLQWYIQQASLYTAKYYTPQSFTRLQRMLTNARAVNQNPRSSAYQVNLATQNLKWALNTIVRIPQTVNKQTLVATINTANTYTLSFYTPNTRQQLLNTINEALRINANTSATQAMVDLSVKNLQLALQQMQLSNHTRSELTPLVQKAYQVTTFPGAFKQLRAPYGTWYTQASVTNLANIMPASMQTYTDHNASQTDINRAYVLLTKALNNLTMSVGPWSISKMAPITTTMTAFKANLTALILPTIYGKNGAVQAGTINWNPIVTIKIKGQTYNLTTNIVRTLNALTPGKYTLTYTVNGGNNKQAIKLTAQRSLIITAGNTNRNPKPSYHFNAANTVSLYRNPSMYSTLPYVQLNNTPVLYDNLGNVVDNQSYRMQYQIMIGNQAVGLFDNAIDYQLPATYRMQYTAIAMGTNKVLAQLNQNVVVNNPTNQNSFNPRNQYHFTSLAPVVLAASDFKGLGKSGDTGDGAFDPYYQVGLVDQAGRQVTNYGNIMIVSTWNELYYGPNQMATPGNYQLQYQAIDSQGKVIATASRKITITN